MADKDDNVYMAKLAEQAERYDGKLPLPFTLQKLLAQLLTKLASQTKLRLTLKASNG